jgi:O-antigen/teichoic acid export membrane protein
LTLANKTIDNALAGIIGFAWPILLSLFTTPYIVHKLGNDAYGILALVTSVLGFFAFLDLGVTNASIKYIAEAFAKRDIAEINRIIGSSLAVYLTVGTLGACIIFLMTSTLVQNILKIPASFAKDTTFAFYLAACGFILNMMLGVFAAVPKAIQKYGIVTKVNILVGSSLTLFTVLILYLGYGFREVVILNFVSSLISLAVYLFLTKRLVDGVIVRVNFDTTTFKKLFAFGFFSLMGAISGTILFQFDKLLICAFVGSAYVAFYVVPANIATMIHTLIANQMSVVFPLCSELHSTGKHDQLKDLYLKGSKYAFILAISVATPIIVLSSKIMHFWMGAEYGEKSGMVLSVLATSYLVTSLTVIPHYLINGIGKPKINAIFSLISGILNLCLCLILIPNYGIIGAASANLANFAIVALYLVVIDKHIMRIGILNLLIKIWLRPLLVAMVQGCMIIWLFAPFINSILNLLITLLFSVLIYYLLAYFFRVFNAEDIYLLKHFIDTKRIQFLSKTI